jgi:hypothetical protein
MAYPVFNRAATGLILGFFVLLAPTPQPAFERNGAADIVRLKTASCEYRGITATFEELTRAYALEAFEKPELTGWQARTSPHNPESETLITALFSTQGPRLETASDPNMTQIRRLSGQTLAVTWRLNDMNGIQITPYNPYAEDAIGVFRGTVERFLRQMRLSTVPTVLRQGAGTSFAALDSLGSGVLLLEQERQGTWSRVRQPSSSLSGWLPTEQLQSINNNSD